MPARSSPQGVRHSFLPIVAKDSSEVPHHAWWRQLLSWPGDGSCPHVHGAKSSDQGATASTHLRWAKRVAVDQADWLKERRTFTRPPPRPHRRKPQYPASTQPSEWALRDPQNERYSWEETLRFPLPGAEQFQESKSRKQRREWALSQLRSAQLKWRQDQKERGCRQRLLASRADVMVGTLGVAESDSAEEYAISANEAGGSSSRDSFSSSQGEDFDHVPSMNKHHSPRTFHPVASVDLDFSGTVIPRTSIAGSSSSNMTNVEALSGSDSERGFPGDPEGCSKRSSLNVSSGPSKVSSRRSSAGTSGRGEGSAPTSGSTRSETVAEERANAPPSRSMRPSEEIQWRAEFPLEILDLLARFYEDSPVDTQGCRIIDFDNLSTLTLNLLGISMQAISDENLGSDSSCSGSLVGFGANRQIRSLSQLLHVVRSQVERASTQFPQSFWSPEDLQLISATFRRHTTTDRIAIAKLFGVVEALELGELRANDAEQQKWLADVTRRVLARAPNESRVDPSLRGFFTLDEFVRIVTCALKEKECDRRRLEFARELEAEQAGGYTPAEFEDLRELHVAYAAIEGGAPLARLTALFESLGVRELSVDERKSLREIVLEHTPAEHLAPSVATPIVTFIAWMRVVFAKRIGDLRWSGTGSYGLEDLAGRRGFHAVMLREHLAIDALAPPDPCLRPRRRSFDFGPQGEASPAPETAPHQLSKEKQPSRRGSKSSLHLGRASKRHTPTRSRAGSASGSQCGPLTSKSSRSSPKRSNSVGPMRSNVGSSSRSQSASLRTTPGKSGSRAQSSRGSGDSSGTVSAPLRGTLGTLVLHKGLPPSNAILGRREMRATSVDLTASSGALFATPQKKSTLPDSSSADVELPGTMPSFLTSAGPSASRRVKAAGDSQQLVEDAIAKLSSLETCDR